MRHDTHFSLDEARDLLDELAPKVDEILELRHDLDAKGFDITTGEFVSEPDESQRHEARQEIERVQQLLDEIHETGALFKDPRFELGMLDFPHLREQNGDGDGEEVYLCWMHGEDDIKYWHPVETGMSGRESIETL
ncbi:MAG: DUF2203 domain-containing protein [Halobacteria archaeon]|nr:DUF2203 domain-containing protein [Halobacteria archaeon]